MSPLIHAERDPYLYCPPVVQVPEGMTADEARQTLADHRPWVALTGDTIDIPFGARVREEYVNGETSPEVYIHPDDVPSRDRDADLIDDLATALRKAWDSKSGLARYPVSDPVWGDLARVAIERVRAA